MTGIRTRGRIQDSLFGEDLTRCVYNTSVGTWSLPEVEGKITDVESYEAIVVETSLLSVDLIM